MAVFAGFFLRRDIAARLERVVFAQYSAQKNGSAGINELKAKAFIKIYERSSKLPKLISKSIFKKKVQIAGNFLK
ncbi:hypothetical protein [Kaistella treverensis]|uniref:hypothetical protein n=1 Tax=Kaistella treverensis TaxID=631455 RepID=UPI001160637B|nr:hypothetical protein [Kaistella treverensis]